MVYLLDFTGNMIKKYSNHSAAVNEISIDETGEYLASCSDDGAAFTFTHSPVRVVSCRVVSHYMGISQGGEPSIVQGLPAMMP